MKHSLRVWLVGITAILVLFATTAQAIHTHTDNQIAKHSKQSTNSCLICHAAHSPSQIAEVLTGPMPVWIEEAVYVVSPQPHSQLQALRLYVRPPPSMI